tara:strand:- start:62 stop:535 length:474 start_codon:yes stop_codon:yes gene_type:complete
MSFEFDLINYINQILNKKNIKIRNDLNNLNLKKKYSEQKTKLFQYNDEINHKKLKNNLINNNLDELYNKEHIHNISYFLIIFIVCCLLYLSRLSYCKVDIKFRKYFKICLIIYWILVLPIFTNKIIKTIIFIYRISFFLFIIMTVILIEENKCKQLM